MRRRTKEVPTSVVSSPLEMLDPFQWHFLLIEFSLLLNLPPVVLISRMATAGILHSLVFIIELRKRFSFMCKKERASWLWKKRVPYWMIYITIFPLYLDYPGISWSHLLYYLQEDIFLICYCYWWNQSRAFSSSSFFANQNHSTFSYFVSRIFLTF